MTKEKEGREEKWMRSQENGGFLYVSIFSSLPLISLLSACVFNAEGWDKSVRHTDRDTDTDKHTHRAFHLTVLVIPILFFIFSQRVYDSYCSVITIMCVHMHTLVCFSEVD